MSEEATRDRFGEALLQLAREDKNVVAMDCDLGRSTRSFHIAQADESRFLEMGISEQDMISTAAGMAHEGKIVFVNTFAVFATGRCFDQIRQQLSLARLNVKVCGSSAGLTQGPDGATHQSVLDVSLMRTLPNMVVIVPADGPQTEAAVRAAYDHQGPVYLRLSRYDCQNVYEEGYPHDIYKAVELREGKEAAIVVCGPILGHVTQLVDPKDTSGALLDRLADTGSHLLRQTLDALEAGMITPIAQQHDQATYAPKLQKSDSRIDWQLPAIEIDRRIRAMTPIPGAWTTMALSEHEISLSIGPVSTNRDIQLDPGVICVIDRRVFVGSATYALELDRIKPPGKKFMLATDWMRGLRTEEGKFF